MTIIHFHLCCREEVWKVRRGEDGMEVVYENEVHDAARFVILQGLLAGHAILQKKRTDFTKTAILACNGWRGQEF